MFGKLVGWVISTPVALTGYVFDGASYVLGVDDCDNPGKDFHKIAEDLQEEMESIDNV